jgi:hypothetical protein
MMNEMIAGAVAMACCVAGLFFIRFWRRTGDRLFVFFALSFFVLAVNRLGLAFATRHDVRTDYLYWVRFLAFSLILLAVLDKNRPRKPPSS